MSPIQVEVLGTGCKKCQQLEANARAAISDLNLEAEILHITDPIEIAQRRVMSTPALTVNGKVVGKGKVMTSEEIKPFLQV
ncbi:MAG: thioredoxin family protein [Thermosynechococcaceae cyanobacterium]